MLVLAMASVAVEASAQALVSLSPEMHWRHIGPYRGGRGRAATGVPSQPNLFYITFDNGGVWKLLLARQMKQAGLDIDLNKAL